MSQRVNDILRQVAELSTEEKALLIQKVISGQSGSGGHGYRHKSESFDAINFAPRGGSKCPVCGR